MSVLGSIGARTVRSLLLGALGLAFGAGIVAPAALAQQGSPRNIPQVASANSNFSTLVSALTEAELVEPLSADGPFTVFAPTNDAFGKIDSGTLESLLKPENRQKLTSILTYHVVPGRVTAADALRARTARTLSGQTLTFSFSDGRLKVNDSVITSIDIPASNGVIHVIDTVLMPPMDNAPSGDAATPGPAAARDLIDRAIRLGAPLFNEGQAEACVAVYAIAARGIIGLGSDNLPAAVVTELRESLDAANREKNASERAWILRRGLDRASEMLAETPMTRGKKRH